MSNKFKSWQEKWEKCNRCELACNTTTRAIYRGHNNQVTLPVDFLWVGESPTKADAAIRYPFSGSVGVVLDEIMSAVTEHTSLKKHLVINAMGCVPSIDETTGVKLPTTDYQSNTCFDHVIELCSIVKPTVAVMMGKSVATLANMLPMGYPKKIVEISHPAFITFQPDKEQQLLIAEAIGKVINVVVKNEFHIPF